MRYAIVTFGCRVNQADSADIERELQSAGGAPSTPDDADLVIVNTCSVTANADHGARQVIRRIARNNPSARIVATGCYATRAADDLSKLPGVAAIIPNHEKTIFVSELERRAPEALTTAARYGGGDHACGASMAPGSSGRTSYTLRVQTGCDETCAYCIIPSTRGSGRSKSLEAVASEVDRIASEGFKEASLTGVHIGSYGRDLTPASSLLGLLRALDRHPSSVLFRLSSLEPMDCSDEIVDLVARSGRFAPHLHLPLQSASDRVLRAMRRPYTVAHYRRVSGRVRELMPHAGIGSDMVVGFPGETEDDHRMNLKYLMASPLTYLHVFPYSDRRGTEATDMPGKLDKPTIRERARAVREVGGSLAAAFHAAQLGAERPALTIEGGRIAVTDNYLKVHVPQCVPENERVRVRITSTGQTVTGVVVH